MRAAARTAAAATLVSASLLAGAAVNGPAYALSSQPFAAPAGATGGAPAGAPVAQTSLLDLLPADVRDRMTAQIPLVDAASVLRTAVEQGQSRGYAGIGLVDDHVTLWWKGALPADIAAAVATARRTAPVEVVGAKYSRTELLRASARITPLLKADRAGAAHAVRLRTDGSGIDIAVDGRGTAKLPTLPATGVSTRIVESDRMTERSRNNDSAPFDGGVGIGETGPWCTAGFGVRDVSSGAGYLISAEHCGSIGQSWRTGWDPVTNTGTLIGHTVDSNDDHDTMLISTPSPGDHIYVGGVDDEVRARVTGWTEVFPGQLLCQSGYTSARVTGGPVCNLQVQFHYDDFEDLVEATQLDGDDSARGGDSGGPVYAVNADGTVLAAGTTTRSAGPGFGFQDFATHRDDYGDIVPATEIASTCRVSYVITDSWGTGFNASVTVHNSGPAVSGWSLAWSFPGDQVIQGYWHGQFQQTGSSVVVTNDAHNVTIPGGGSVNIGFTASGTPTTPALFTLNGTACT